MIRFGVLVVVVMLIGGCATAKKKEWPLDEALHAVERTVFAYALVDDKNEYTKEQRVGDNRMVWVP